MSKRTYNLATGVIGGIATIGVALVTFFEPGYMVAINTAIGIATTAAVKILNMFVER